jgi:hypothetical protein
MFPAKKQTAQQAAFRFFLANAGYSYNPQTETPAQGKAKTARKLAKAERDARAYGYTFEWSDDWSIGNHKEAYGADSVYAEREPDSCEQCICRDEKGNVIASLGCIDDANNEYRRVIEAELACEALASFYAEKGQQ